MEEKPKGGSAPIEPEKPKISNEDKPVFAYGDLNFEDFFIIENRKYIRFFVGGEKPFYLEMQYSEFVDYQLTFFEMRNEAIIMGQQCLCDQCIPLFETDEPTKVTVVELKDGENIGEKDREFPTYIVWNLVESLVIGIHSEDEHEDVKID